MPKCSKCNESLFDSKKLRFDVNLKKELFEVILSSKVCRNCNATLTDNEHLNALRKATADRYREAHGLLTSNEIRSYREKLGLSQIAFARFLKVGEASIKRWETYYIQDDSQDDHIRVKCDMLYSQSNYFYLQEKYNEIDAYSGFRPFSALLVKNIRDFFLEQDPECLAYLPKLYFYIDFLHFKRYTRCITGMRYTPLKTGPCPSQYDQITSFIQNPFFDSQKNASLDDNEKNTVMAVHDLFLSDRGQTISNLASRERGFLETPELHLISYAYSQHLLI